jgi:proline iminopeptidase
LHASTQNLEAAQRPAVDLTNRRRAEEKTMDIEGALFRRIVHPTGPLTRAAKRAGLTAIGTYTAYVLYGLAHPALLRAKVNRHEKEKILPGDEIVGTPDWVTNFAIDISATPEEIWPWLVQIGYGRAGWYTWFPLDNGGIPSADVIVPALQKIQVGDVIPDGAKAAEGFGVWRVHQLDPARALVLHSRRNLTTGHEVSAGREGDESFIDCSWAFVLTETVLGVTRLHIRVRARSHAPRWTLALARTAFLLFGFGDNVMENTMLQGIRTRAERSSQAPLDPTNDPAKPSVLERAKPYVDSSAAN